MQSLLNQPELLIAFGVLLGLLLFLFIFVLILNVRLKKVQTQFRRLVKGASGENLETALERIYDLMEKSAADQKHQMTKVKQLEQVVSKMKGNLAVIRYAAFEGHGSDLSFSVAMVDDDKNGVVLTGIYGNDVSRIYAKPVQAGKSKYNLSDEEQEAIRQAYAGVI